MRRPPRRRGEGPSARRPESPRGSVPGTRARVPGGRGRRTEAPRSERPHPRSDHREQHGERVEARRGAREPERVVYGRHPVAETLRSQTPVRRVLVSWSATGAASLEEIVRLAEGLAVPVRRVERDELDAATSGGVHQGVAAILPPLRFREIEDVVTEAMRRGETPLLLALDQVQDPHNAGALLRSAHAVGAHGVILPERRSAGFGAGMEKSSAGAVNFVPLCQVVNLVRTLQWLKRQGLWVVGLDAGAKLRYDAADWRRPAVIVVGNEGEGLRRLVGETCDDLVSLPMRGHIGSLNAAVAGSIVLYEAWRARGFDGVASP